MHRESAAILAVPQDRPVISATDVHPRVSWSSSTREQVCTSPKGGPVRARPLGKTRGVPSLPATYFGVGLPVSTVYPRRRLQCFTKAVGNPVDQERRLPVRGRAGRPSCAAPAQDPSAHTGCRPSQALALTIDRMDLAACALVFATLKNGPPSTTLDALDLV
jgi:hypothetical protein